MGVPITVAHGNGIGPEIMDATLKILTAAGAKLDIETIEIGEDVYKQGFTSGIKDESWDSLRRTKVFLKAPITTPQGGGVKSLNVTIRKTLGFYANVRPCVSYHPYIKTMHPNMDVVIVRENEEDLYAGIEHRQTQQVCQSLKLISRLGSEKIIRYAFEYAKANKRKKITCVTKDNIMKLSDGLFHQVFNEVAIEYPEIENEHMIVDIGMAKLANSPMQFDVMVLPNLYGDIISDIAAEITGSVGLVPSINLGEHIAMFEAIHGSAPDIAGKNLANPSALLLAAIEMMTHVGQPDVGHKIHNAWFKTLEDGIHTGDIYKEGLSKQKVGTKEFAQAVIDRLGQKPAQLKAVATPGVMNLTPPKAIIPQKKELVGIDLFLDCMPKSINKFGDQISSAGSEKLKLIVITNRGVKIYPNGFEETFCTDHWCCRFMASDGKTITHKDIIGLLGCVEDLGFDVIKTENLYTFDGKYGFSLAQGQ